MAIYLTPSWVGCVASMVAPVSNGLPEENIQKNIQKNTEENIHPG